MATRWERVTAATRDLWCWVPVAWRWVWGAFLLIDLVILVGALPGWLRDGFAVVLPVAALSWALFQPAVQKRQADAKRDEERAEMRATAILMAESAVEYLDHVRDHYQRYVTDIYLIYLPEKRYDEFIDILGSIKAEKLPRADVLVGLAELRGVLRRVQAEVEARDIWAEIDPKAKENEGKPFGAITNFTATKVADYIGIELTKARRLLKVIRNG